MTETINFQYVMWANKQLGGLKHWNKSTIEDLIASAPSYFKNPNMDEIRKAVDSVVSIYKKEGMG